MTDNTSLEPLSDVYFRQRLMIANLRLRVLRSHFLMQLYEP